MGLVNACLRPFVHPVTLSNSLEPKFRWMAFPGLIRGIGIIHFFVFVLLVFNPETVNSFIFNKTLIAKGEYWRAISFIALPPIPPGGWPLLLSTLLMFFILRITFLINDSLEHAWGAFRTSLYVYAVLGCMILAHFWSGPLLSDLGGVILYAALFIAFATIFPNIEFRLFLVVPVKIGILAIILAVITILQCFTGGLQVTAHILLTFFPYLAWAVPRFLKWYVMRGRTAARRTAFQRQALPEGETFHKCEQCGATDSSHPERDFRVTEEERELCNACLAE